MAYKQVLVILSPRCDLHNMNEVYFFLALKYTLLCMLLHYVPRQGAEEKKSLHGADERLSPGEEVTFPGHTVS